MTNIFERAAKVQLRFTTHAGVITTEDLWTFRLTDLDTIAKSLNKDVKNNEEESFIKVSTTNNTLLNLRFDIIKHIITVRLEELENSKKRLEKKAQKEKILAIMANKQDESLQGKTEEELAKMLENL